MFGKNKRMTFTDFEKILLTVNMKEFEDDIYGKEFDADKILEFLKLQIPNFLNQPGDYQDQIYQRIIAYLRQTKAREEIVADRQAGKYGGGAAVGMPKGFGKGVENKPATLPNDIVQMEVVSKGVNTDVNHQEKADYIDEKSKLTEKQLLAEIVILLENIRNDAKINSETMNQKLSQISKSTDDAKYELKYSREDDKARHKENKETEWEIS